MNQALKYLLAVITAFYTFLPAPASAQNHKQDEKELREALLQLPNSMPTGLTWNQAEFDSIKTDTLSTLNFGKPDTTFVRKFYLITSLYPSLERDSLLIAITYKDAPPLWHPDENDALEFLLTSTKRAQPDTTNPQQRQSNQGIFSFLKTKKSKTKQHSTSLQAPLQESLQDTLITEWYSNRGSNGWFPGQPPLDPRDKGTFIIKIGAHES